MTTSSPDNQPRCSACRFYRASSVGGSFVQHKCYRYPTTAIVLTNSWCGEFDAAPIPPKEPTPIAKPNAKARTQTRRAVRTKSRPARPSG